MREKNNHKMEVLDRLVLSCVDITNQGMGVVKIDRFPFFVENLLPDEEAEIEITEIKSKFGFARVVEYLKISENRVAPICPFYDVCGGCQIMHIKDQNGFKYNQTHKTLKQFINPVINSPLDLGYRNKMTFQADKKKIGFYQQRTNEIVDIDYCYLQSDLKNEILKFTRKNYSNLTEVIIRGDDEIMVNLSGDNIDPTLLFHTFNEIKSLYVNRKHVLGNETIIQTLDDLKFHVSLDSFFQVNTQQTENLYHQITKFLNPKRNERVLDLYCGVGSIALMVAKHATNVIGVEINQTAVEDANKNKELNKITNVDFICDDATSFLNKFNESIDVVIVDPPRKGLTKQGIEDIIKTKAQKVIYVSCNPITLKRDLEILSVYYQVDEIVPFDMFPQTVHVECITLLNRK